MSGMGLSAWSPGILHLARIRHHDSRLRTAAAGCAGLSALRGTSTTTSILNGVFTPPPVEVAAEVPRIAECGAHPRIVVTDPS
jgi:hypothetical protein